MSYNGIFQAVSLTLAVFEFPANQVGLKFSRVTFRLGGPYGAIIDGN